MFHHSSLLLTTELLIHTSLEVAEVDNKHLYNLAGHKLLTAVASSSRQRKEKAQAWFEELESAYKFHLCACSQSEQNGQHSVASARKQLSLSPCCELLLIRS